MSKKEEQEVRDSFQVRTPFNRKVNQSEAAPELAKKVEIPKEEIPKEKLTEVVDKGKAEDATKTTTQNEQKSEKQPDSGSVTEQSGSTVTNEHAGATGDGRDAEQSNVSGSGSGKKLSGEGETGIAEKGKTDKA